MQHKTKKRLRGIPVIYDERKKKYSIALTPSTWKKLHILAIDADVSASEYVERTIRFIYTDTMEKLGD